MKITTPKLPRTRVNGNGIHGNGAKNGHAAAAQNSELADLRGQMAAIRKSQAVIEFDLDGTILTANDNFLSVSATRSTRSKAAITACSSNRTYRHSAAYRQFWVGLNRRRIRQLGRVQTNWERGSEVWIQASYNPIFDPQWASVCKVVKFATDITARKAQERRLSRPDRRHQQVAGGDRIQSRRHDHHRQ